MEEKTIPPHLLESFSSQEIIKVKLRPVTPEFKYAYEKYMKEKWVIVRVPIGGDAMNFTVQGVEIVQPLIGGKLYYMPETFAKYVERRGEEHIDRNIERFKKGIKTYDQILKKEFGPNNIEMGVLAASKVGKATVTEKPTLEDVEKNPKANS